MQEKLVHQIREKLTIIQGEQELAAAHTRDHVAKIDRLLRQIEALLPCTVEDCPLKAKGKPQ